jgi:multiple sugar transport system permease protein
VWAFLTPTVVLYGAYTVYPIIASYWYSFVEWNGFDSTRTWVGLQNYRAVMADPLFWNSFRITVLFMVAVVPLKVLLSLLLALVLNSPKLPMRTLFRTAFFLPVVTTTAIVGVVMQLVFDPASGPVNVVLRKLGLVADGINFLGDPKLALWTVVGVYIWTAEGERAGGGHRCTPVNRVIGSNQCRTPRAPRLAVTRRNRGTQRPVCRSRAQAAVRATVAMT